MRGDSSVQLGQAVDESVPEKVHIHFGVVVHNLVTHSLDGAPRHAWDCGEKRVVDRLGSFTDLADDVLGSADQQRVGCEPLMANLDQFCGVGGRGEYVGKTLLATSHRV